VLQEEDLGEKPGWHNRGYLPHFDVPNKVQAITFRLADALPRQVVESWQLELADQPDKERKVEEQRRLQRYLDAGRGECVLKDPKCAEIVENALLHFDCDRYMLLAWVVMPNHVHVVAELADDIRLGDVVESWKKFSARHINATLGRSGRLWFKDYYDRWIRNGDHLRNAIAYTHANPVKARLCQAEDNWRWSSAWSGR
jgi:REP element-mobilizing transposase RayT